MVEKIFLFFVGLIFGSFFNSLIFRFKTKKKIFWARSHCPYCLKILNWKDLIPVFSFLILKGKCRYCQKPISLQYPLVEMATGLLFLLAFFLRKNFLDFLFLLFFFSGLLIIFVFDLKYMEIPDEIIFPLIFLAFIYNIINLKSINFLNNFLSGIFTFLFFYSFYFFSKGNLMGSGDAFLGLFLGLFLGFPKILISLFFSFILGGLIALALVFLKKKNFHSQIAFSPFLIFGFFFTLFFPLKFLIF